MQLITKVLLALALASPTLAIPNRTVHVDVPQIREVLPNPQVKKLIECESSGKSVKIVDKNGYYSYGILQFQSSTWNGWSKESGITGDPMNPQNAIEMANWAVDKGYGYHWTCWHLLGLVNNKMSK